MSMTESEANKELERVILKEKKNNELARKALKQLELIETDCRKVADELQQYKAIGTVSEFRENKNFLEFLYNTIQPNEMEQYLAMYHALEEKGE